MATAPSSLALLDEKSPWKAPMGVRAAPTITTGSFMVVLQSKLRKKKGAHLRGSVRSDLGTALHAKTDGLGVGIHIFDVAVENALLALLPILTGAQIGMVGQKKGPDACIAQQKTAELFRENIVLANRVPGLGRQFIFLVAGGRDVAEIAVRHILDFIVIIKHDAPLAGDAEILVQHIAGKNIRRHQLLDGIAVLAHPVFDGGRIARRLG